MKTLLSLSLLLPVVCFYIAAAQDDEMIRRWKVNLIEFVERAGRSPKFEVIAGVEVVQEGSLGKRLGKSLDPEDLRKLDGGTINELLKSSLYDFLQSHSIKVNVPRMLEEARRKNKRNRYGGALLAAMAIKGALMSMAYKGIAVMAGTALIIGKMALILAAILGLKKLLSGKEEKTTLEIIKHPSHSTSHSYSSSVEDDHGHYRRSLADEMDALERIFKKFY